MSGGSAALMLLLEMLLLCALLLAPVAIALRRAGTVQGRRAPALALHRQQRDALDRDAASGLLDARAHRDAALEIDRRLLAEAAQPEPSDAPRPTRRFAAALILLPIPVLALALYAVGGHPGLPAQPLANRVAAEGDRAREDARLVDELRDTLARQDPDSPQTRQGFLLLGQTEAARGNWAAAAESWRVVLRGGFDPVVAVQAAEAQCRADDGVSADSVALFRRALREGSQDAPWRGLAEQRIAQFEHARDPH